MSLKLPFPSLHPLLVPLDERLARSTVLGCLLHALCHCQRRLIQPRRCLKFSHLGLLPLLLHGLGPCFACGPPVAVFVVKPVDRGLRHPPAHVSLPSTGSASPSLPSARRASGTAQERLR